MENGQAGDDRLAANSEEPSPCDVTRTTKKEEELTQLESKTTTVQVQSESSQLNTSTLSTKPLVANKEEHENLPYATEGKYVPQGQTTHCEEGSAKASEKGTEELNLESVQAAEDNNSQPIILPVSIQQTKTIEENSEISPEAIYPEANLSLNTEQPSTDLETQQQSLSGDPKLNETAKELPLEKETTNEIKQNPKETLEQSRQKTLKILSEEALKIFNKRAVGKETDLALVKGQQENRGVYQREEEKLEVVQNNIEDIQEEKLQPPIESVIQTEEAESQKVQLPQSEELSVEIPSEEVPSKGQVSEEQPSEQQVSEQQPPEQQPTEQQLSEQQSFEQQPSEQQPIEQQLSEQQPSEQQSFEQQPLEEQPFEQQPSAVQSLEEQPSGVQSLEKQASAVQSLEEQQPSVHHPTKNTPEEQPPKEQPSAELQSSEVLQISQNTNSCSEAVVDNPPVSDTVNEEGVPQSTEINTMADADSQKTHNEVRSAEIQEENIKNQLHEIIHEIDIEVSREEEDGARSHTWQPKGRYEIRRTPIKYEDIIAVEIPDIQIAERKKAAAKPVPKAKPQKQEISLEPLKILRHTVENGEPISPLEIPVGIPLLAKILPKDENGEEEPREKIPLERLFTPATDADEIAPHKKKRAFASSSFYGPDHPTIDDQLELAHKISVSLIDENNKSSKGQNMYMKRKNRSSKWIHQAAQYEMDDIDEEKPQAVDKSPLKLVMNPKGMQDYSAVQRHYEELLSSSESVQQITRMELGMEIANNLESPTGKGAALFAKRKKRMDKFIVDEMTVQQQQKQQTPPVQEEVKSLQKAEVRSTTQKSFSSHQTSTTTKNGPASLLAPTVAQPGNLKLPDLTTILTQPKPPEKKTSASSSAYSSGRSMVKTKPISSSRSHSADSKPSLLAKSASTAAVSAFNTPSSQKRRVGELKRTSSGSSFNAFSDKTFTALDEDPLANVRPGSPPVVLVPDGKGGFVEKREIVESSKPVNATTNDATATNEGGAIYTAEVKVVQKQSLPSTPNMELPVATPANYAILDQLSTATDEEKRKSFNFAAKGWGTYNNFYTPLHLGVL